MSLLLGCASGVEVLERRGDQVVYCVAPYAATVDTTAMARAWCGRIGLDARLTERLMRGCVNGDTGIHERWSCVAPLTRKGSVPASGAPVPSDTGPN